MAGFLSPAYGAVTNVQPILDALDALQGPRSEINMIPMYEVHALGQESYIKEVRLTKSSMVLMRRAALSLDETWHFAFFMVQDHKGEWHQQVPNPSAALDGTILQTFNIEGNGFNQHHMFFDKELAELYLQFAQTDPGMLADRAAHLAFCNQMFSDLDNMDWDD